jgi:hypothetical protein
MLMKFSNSTLTNLHTQSSRDGVFLLSFLALSAINMERRKFPLTAVNRLSVC